MNLQILHEDADLIAVHKPHGLLCQPGRGPEKFESVATRIRATWPDARIVHRLDRDTSGVMVLARGPAAHRHIGRQFETRQVEKTYVAQVWGEIEGAGGRIDLPLRKDMDQRLPPRHLVDHELGKPASTTWRRLACEDGQSRLEIRPITGR
ncbi:MAG: RluA family pseudouridine synthase, partial [Phycisphaerae bacterium]|nr:RluA family pseudouridine synthase [Phycisphaerae bacterium]